MSGTSTQRDGIALAEGLSDFGEGGNHFGWGPPWLGDAGRAPFFSYALAFALQLRKSTENLSQDSRQVLN
jgi:hypothetical protein